MNFFINQLHLYTSGQLGLFILFLVVAILFSLFIYRRTNPIVSPVTRFLLFFFRAVALVLLLFVVFETSLTYTYNRTQPPVLAIAIDNSASMTISDTQGSREQTVQSLFNSDVLVTLNRNFELKTYAFSNDLETFNLDSDSIRFLGDETNIQETLQRIKAENLTENLNAVLLISDGSYNSGGNPVRSAEQIGVPVYSIGVGSPQPITDVAITDVESNPFTYAGQTTPINITIRNSGYGQLAFPIEITSQGSVVTRETVQLPPSPSDQTYTLDYQASDIGRQKLQVNLPIQQNEYSQDNNQQTLYIDVLKSKLNILMIAGSVTPDVAFFKRHLNTERYSITSLVQKSANAFYESPPTAEGLRDMDMFILYDFPRQQMNTEFVQRLSESIRANRQPVFYILGPHSSVATARQWFPGLPIQRASRLNPELLLSPELSPAGVTHPVVQIGQDLTQTQRLWSQVPPLFAAHLIQELAPGTEVLVYGRREDNPSAQVLPLFALNAENGKSAAMFAHELWRWDLMIRGFERNADILKALLINTVRWLETDRSDNLVRVDMTKTNYNFGEPVEVSVDVFDDNLNPVNDAEVNLTLNTDPPQIVTAFSQGDGSYEATLQPSQPGDYEMNVTATWQGRTLGTEDVLFSVGEYSAELADLQAQHIVLKSVAQASGGQFVPADSADALIVAMQGKPRTTTLTIDQALWNNKFLLLFILLFLTLEWFLRKRKGML